MLAQGSLGGTGARKMAVYLGLDSSTQSLSAIAIEVTDGAPRVVLERSLIFDVALPQYGTRHGVLPADDPLVVMAPPRMWAEALDQVMAGLAASGFDPGLIRAIAGSAQQHGSVYLAVGASERLGSLTPDRPLASQLEGIFSRERSPIWMDASTREDCRAIASAVGGDAALAQLTGSRAFERFTGPQIRKFARTDPDGWARTERVHLVSSFLASLLAGTHAPIDPGDGSGTNLMDLAAGRWATRAVAATAEGLADKLPPIAPPWTIVGELAAYWRERYGLPAARVVSWSGDNPCSLVGVGLVRAGRIGISLGTSDTVFGLMQQPRVDATGTGHVFGSPTGAFMGLTCFTNGSLARERVRDACWLDWAGFSAALARTPAGNRGRVMLPWFTPEITPPVLEPRVSRYGGLNADDTDGNVRAVIEAQMLAMARHSGWMGVAVDTIHATGGAAVNRDILQVMADVFGAEVYRSEVTNSAALGAALRAWHADAHADGRPVSWEEVVGALARPSAATKVSPDAAHHERYRRLAPLYAACEDHALRGGPDPSARLLAFGHQS